MLLLNTNKKSYIRGPSVRLHLIFETLKGTCKCQGHSDLEGLYLVKGLN